MRQQIPHRELRRRIGVKQLEGGIEIGDPRVPVDDTVTHQRRHDRG